MCYIAIGAECSLLQAYFQLRDRTDRFFESAASRYRDQVMCRPGCSRCCVGGLTVVMVEAIAIGGGLGIPSERIHLQAGQLPLSDGGSCAFLDNRGHCRIYAHRPLVCRTHGMPLLQQGDGTISVCDLNFTEVSPHSSIVLNTENLHAALFATNMVYCRSSGVEPHSRVALDRLAQLAGIPDNSAG